MAPLKGSACIVSRANPANPSAPLRKSTGFVAAITRAAPLGPSISRLSKPG